MRRDRTKSAYSGFLRALRDKPLLPFQLTTALSDETLPVHEAESVPANSLTATVTTNEEPIDA